MFLTTAILIKKAEKEKRQEKNEFDIMFNDLKNIPQ
jgi:hypothetical protein